MDDVLAFLKKTDLFSAVSPAILAEVAPVLKSVDFPPGHTIFSEGDPGDCLYLVQEGLVRVERGSIPVAVRRPGDCIGEMAVLDQSPRSSTLVAQTQVKLLRLAAEDFHRMIAQHPEISSGIHRVLSTKLRESLPGPSDAGVTSVLPKDSSTPVLLLPNDLTGVTFAGRYEMKEQLGHGGMAYVYRAQDRLLGVPVALKVLHRISEESILVRFKQEVILARKVLHPSVCRIFDFGESGGLHFVSMELIDGVSLAAKLRSNPTRKESLDVLCQVLEALVVVHAMGIVHRDIKPQNIMIDHSGRAIVMDFGVALWTQADSRLTQDGQFVGTLHYMAPEQFYGAIDHRADLYSLGVVMYEMFTGIRPFESGSTAAMVAAHLNVQPRKPREIDPDIPPKLEKVILKALQKSPKKRYQSALDMLHDLDKIRV